ncbi:MAG: hypothetical protein A3B23_03995 [Candidatus Colwellbacteria bacterium RIFCSPLOWO2_01_FULL_48_10]|uniref:General secretion pathway GspH domain-containing protein n=2 Tax=Bacteria candidate phyla TaxID=1783234 RepID=A0A1G1Z806_9BACT|nr:MAG: hypothetical protein A3B23_03995 [Candidatus Colwellbacteria bacterium RIFCSPLOWO2_01_FULL_48_10]
MDLTKELKSYRAEELSHGYTFIEMVVAVGIMVVIGSIAVVYSGDTSRQLLLLRMQSQMVAFFTRAKSLSQNFQLTSPAGKIICAYGVNVNRVTGELIVFQDLAPDSGSCAAADNLYNQGEELAGSIDRFNIDTRALELITSTDISSPDIENVVFLPPDSKVVINDDDFLKSGSVVVQVRGTSIRFEVRVNEFAQITAK